MVMSRERQEDGSAQKETKSQSHASRVCKTVFLEKSFKRISKQNTLWIRKLLFYGTIESPPPTPPYKFSLKTDYSDSEMKLEMCKSVWEN